MEFSLTGHVFPNKKSFLMTFWEKLDAFPPIQCRLLARVKPGGPPKGNAQIAQESGLSVLQVVALSEQTDWAGVDVPTMRRFTRACGVDFENPGSMKRITMYLRGHNRKGYHIAPKFEYLRTSPDWDSFYRPLAEKLIHHAATSKR